MSFEFNFFDQQPPQPPTDHADPNNLLEVMKKFEDESFRFDQFDPVDQNPNQKSFNSDFFKEQPKPEEKIISAKSKGKSDSVDFDNSRNLSQISYMGEERNRSFRYEPPPPPTSNLKSNPRYQKVQSMLSNAKKNNLDMFYRNLDQQNVYKVQQKFNSKEDFNHYRSQFKAYKREREESFKQTNGQYNFRNNHYKPQTSPSAGSNNEIENIFAGKGGFKKKDIVPFNQVQNQSRNKPAQSKKLLPNQLMQEDEGFDFFQIGEEQINKQVKNYQTKQYMKEAEKFFQAESQQKKDKKQKTAAKLQPIREERPNLFQVSHQQQKMAKLINNFNDMKNNYNELMCNFKQTNTDHQKIIRQLTILKQECSNKESKLKMEAQSKKERIMLKQREKEEKEKKLSEIKEQIAKMRTGSEKDLLFLKINQKIQSLEGIVKNAINSMNQEKEPKFVPKIYNIYQQQSPHSSRQKSEGGFSRQSAVNQNQMSQIRHLQEQRLAPVRNALRQLKQEKRQEQILYNLDQFCSPLQLDLSTQQFPLNLSRNRSQQLQHPFVPPEGAKQYLPNTLDTTNKYLRRCLTQKSSVIFESFQFYITGKFTITSNDRYPVLCEVRVANKCAVSLYDVFVVVFGPQAQQSQLQMRPNKMMHDEFRHSTSFLFEVDLSKSCLQNGGFSVMISYKTDSVNKKKVVFKVLLPFVQLIKPEFIYEQQFSSGWNHMGNETFIMPKTLDFKNIRSHQDLKLIMPFIEVGEYDPNAFSYGIMFRYPTSQVVFMMKITCYVNGKASIHLKSSETNGSDRKIREEILDIMNFLCFG